MINKKRNVRVQLTLSKQQYSWLEKFAKNKGITISKLVSWLLTKKSKEVTEAIELNEQPLKAVEHLENEEQISDQEMLEIINKITNHK